MDRFAGVIAADNAAATLLRAATDR